MNIIDAQQKINEAGLEYRYDFRRGSIRNLIVGAMVQCNGIGDVQFCESVYVSVNDGTVNEIELDRAIKATWEGEK